MLGPATDQIEGPYATVVTKESAILFPREPLRSVHAVIAIQFNGIPVLIDYGNNRALPRHQIPPLKYKSAARGIQTAVGYGVRIVQLFTRHRHHITLACHASLPRRQAINQWHDRQHPGKRTLRIVQLHKNIQGLRVVAAARLGCIRLIGHRCDVFGPLSVGQLQNPRAALPEISFGPRGLSTINTAIRLDNVDGISCAQRRRYNCNSPIRESKTPFLRERKSLMRELLCSLSSRQIIDISRAIRNPTFSPQDAAPVPLTDASCFYLSLRIDQRDHVVAEGLLEPRHGSSGTQPHCDNGISRAEILHRRRLRSVLRHAARQQHDDRQCGRADAGPAHALATERSLAVPRAGAIAERLVSMRLHRPDPFLSLR